MASIRKRGDTFTITAYMGYDEKGKQRKKTTTFIPPPGVTAGKAEKLAKQYAAVWEEKIKGYVSLDENRTFSELAKWYYDTVAPSILKVQTLERNQSTIDKHVMPFLGREKLKNITPAMLDSLFADLLKNGNSEMLYRLKDKALFDGMKIKELSIRTGIDQTTLRSAMTGRVKKETAEKLSAVLGLPLESVFVDATENHGLSGRTVTKVKTVLSAIFTAAVKKEIMRRNPCKLATPPKIDVAPAPFLDEQESRIFLQALHEQPDFQFEVICNLFLATGIRSGELRALHWDDINLDTGLLYIRHTLVRMHEQWIRDTPKTLGSERRIVVPAYILDLLKEHKYRQLQEKNNFGMAWQAPDAVFTNSTGGYMVGTVLNRKLKTVCEKAGLPPIHLHSLRHTHASLLINSNVTARVIADRLGHSSTQITLDTYSHVFAESEVKAMQAIDMALFRKAE